MTLGSAYYLLLPVIGNKTFKGFLSRNAIQRPRGKESLIYRSMRCCTEEDCSDLGHSQRELLHMELT